MRPKPRMSHTDPLSTLPLKQGLKLAGAATVYDGFNTSLNTSIKTRIETYFPLASVYGSLPSLNTSIKTRIETTVTVAVGGSSGYPLSTLPLKQGLKHGILR